MCFLCKTCGSKTRIRDSRTITDSTRSVYYECTNSECGEEREGTHSIGRIVRPSRKSFKQFSLDAFISSIPEHKRAAVLNVINS